MSMETRFWAKVDKTDDCWLWTAVTRSGYGEFTITTGKKVRAHRLAYELTNGPIPEGLEIDHLCRVRACVNPDHLEAVTHQENVARGLAPLYNGSKTHCAAGHEYSVVNTYLNNRGWRRCRTCGRAATRRYKQRLRSSV